MRSIRHWICMLGLVLLAGLTVACGRSETPVQNLRIVSPHGSRIKSEFASAFERWHQEKYGATVKVNYPDHGGTSTIFQYLERQYSQSQTCNYDLVWGGGSAEFDRLATKNFIVSPASAGVPLDATLLAELPVTVQGTILRGPEDKWYGSTMSYFGLVVSKTRMQELGLQRPRFWADVAAPAWHGQLSLGDPSKSGSVKTCYELVLQANGWERGWGILTGMFANANSIREGGSQPAEEVGSENATAGVVIDFFGRMQVVRQGDKLVEFIVPEGGSSLDSDPIAMLKGAPNAELARRFMTFVLSPAGQQLWVYKPGVAGGPQYRALARMSIRPEVYTQGGDKLIDPQNPFTAPPPLQVVRDLARTRGFILGDLIRFTLIDNHPELARLRQDLARAGDPPELVAQLLAPPFAEGALGEVVKTYQRDDKAKTQLRSQWQADYHKRMETITTALRQRPTGTRP